MIRFEVKYERGHSYFETWERANCFCPNCGHKETWRDTSEGDMDVGPEYLCWRCSAIFYLPNGIQTPYAGDWQNKQRLEAIRASVERSDEPS